MYSCQRFASSFAGKGVPAKGRLEASGGFNAMVSQRVLVERQSEADAGLIGWPKRALDT